MSAKQWIVANFILLITYMAIFGLCVFNHWEKVAWLVILPIALIISFLLKRMKKSN